jgi:pyruvate/2-oxoglutarate dehydrogenase complex dihydrolipoamide acyltransferase (E2) component
MCLTVDHRVVDGAVGAAFLSDLKDGLEDLYLLW